MHAQKAASLVAAVSLAASLFLAAAVLLTSCAAGDSGADVASDELGAGSSWTEPAASTALVPGATVRVALPLAGAFDPAPERSQYADVRGYGLKIEGSGVTWHGELAIDQVRLEGLQPAAEGDAPRSVG